MGKRHIGVIPSDENRCKRDDGKNWRCYEPRSENSNLCQKHHLSYVAKCSGRKKSPAISENYRPIPLLEPNQIWAFSKNASQTIPHYCVISEVSDNVSTVCVTELIPHPILEEEIKWVDEYKNIMSCGSFRPCGKKQLLEIDISLLLFRVFGFKVLSWMGINFYRIFPNKGEVWVVKSKEGGAESKKVEILTFSEEEGVTVCVLTETDGGVYERQMHEGCRLVRIYSRKEMVLFEMKVLVENVDGEGDKQLWKNASEPFLPFHATLQLHFLRGEHSNDHN